MANQTPYRGRFAPSPTGPLHFGSLIAATGSYLQAKSQNGEWLVRIDDIDPPREQAGAAESILKTLDQYGFEWDKEVLYQSTRSERYMDAINQLLKLNLAYPCTCSRKSILEKTGQNRGEVIYPGFCRNGATENNAQHASHSIRLNCQQQQQSFNDAIQGKQHFDFDKQLGDFILQRRDKLFSYQLASGIDDAEQGITEVIRGADLLTVTPSHLQVQKVLNLPSPRYAHLPVVINSAGQKLSKQNLARAISVKDTTVLLFNALKFLGQMPPNELLKASQEEIWNWAISNWQLNLVPSKLQMESKT